MNNTTIDLGTDIYGDGLYTMNGSKGYIGDRAVVWGACAPKRGERMVPTLSLGVVVMTAERDGMSNYTGRWNVGDVVDLGTYGTFRIELGRSAGTYDGHFALVEVSCGSTDSFGRDGRRYCACGIISNPAGLCCETGAVVDADRLAVTVAHADFWAAEEARFMAVRVTE